MMILFIEVLCLNRESHLCKGFDIGDDLTLKGDHCS